MNESLVMFYFEHESNIVCDFINVRLNTKPLNLVDGEGSNSVRKRRYSTFDMRTSHIFPSCISLEVLYCT